MAGLTQLERTALQAIFAEAGNLARGLDRLLDAEVLSRENTGGGFFTTLAAPIAPRRESLHLGEHVWVAVEGLDFGLGIILHLHEQRLPFIEGYAVALEDTLQVNFAEVRFAMVSEPGAMPADFG
ncbi:MAG: hypothetical protein KAF42_06085 [Sphingopyxis terrae]|uniref:Uncharacterized protein n=1 Tax=Sphingopyxis terrae subsp. terrae NBRC 15098 TaxID=1219058 RepID=A0A142W3E1_9SPHN|nr:hypothetical protein [Sphingopyxis terrae]AMU96482.1 hypothetical protein AOA14_17920 [Sphingopyxis terrae subsp. terrae NBRC 15098]MBU7588767.1 hypothetical protein [Sphingopyxis terrae]